MAYFEFMRTRKNIGKAGERLALEYLENIGYQLLQKNYRSGRGEVDIIVIREGTLVFVEVKTRSSSNMPNVVEGIISNHQRQKLRQTADCYLENLSWHGIIRFDAILVYLTTPMRIHHYQGYFD